VHFYGEVLELSYEARHGSSPCNSSNPEVEGEGLQI
jgi:hypothetical protein